MVTGVSVQAHGVLRDEFVFHLCVSVYVYLCVCVCLGMDGMEMRFVP